MSLYHNGKSAHRQYDEGVHLFLKKRGETLSVLLERVRTDLALSERTPLTYAGRLDPMADGLMIILSGDRCKDKDLYTALPKRYHFQILFGVATDTYDPLGIPTEIAFPETLSIESVREAAKTIQQKTQWEYPPYASRPVGGIPLFAHARMGTLPEQMPKKEGAITELVCHDFKEMPFEEVRSETIETVTSVHGDFRQEEIIKHWNEIPNTGRVYIAQGEASVSSGVYIRSIARAIGTELGIPSLAYTITRVSIGDYHLT
jgi:tRNA pseudouridine(55) synthase